MSLLRKSGRHKRTPTSAKPPGLRSVPFRSLSHRWKKRILVATFRKVAFTLAMRAFTYLGSLGIASIGRYFHTIGFFCE